MSGEKNIKRRKAFSIIELLVVISAMSILAGLIVPAVSKARQKAYITKTQAQIASLDLAVSMYQADIGELPVVSTTTFQKMSIHHVVKAPLDPQIAQAWRGPYLDLKTEKETDGVYHLDVWGNAILCRIEVVNNYHKKFLMYSTGANFKDEGGLGDDIKNWVTI